MPFETNRLPYTDPKHMCMNRSVGFECMCEWMVKYPGKREFSCSWCGIYTAGQPRCNECEEHTPSTEEQTTTKKPE